MSASSARRVFYRIDSTRVSFREYWWGSPAAAMLIAPVLKLFRIRIPSATDDPAVEVLAPFEVQAEAFPEEARTRMQPLLETLSGQGYGHPIHHSISDDLHKVETRMVSLAHSSGRSWARIHQRVWSVQSPPREVTFTEVVSEFVDRTFLWSTSAKPDLAAPPTCRVVRRTGAEASEVVTVHAAELAGEEARRAVASVSTTDELRASTERHHAQVRNFHLRRGVFAALTPADRARAEAQRVLRTSAAAEGSKYPEILAEIRALQDQRTNWVTTILVLLVSLGVFVGSAGSGNGSSFTSLSFETLAILVPILFFHEAGHWLAMRLFGYRNLRMFFIPFLGAAVSGRHYNVPGWKKAVVSLMGPLPGIAVGAVLGVVGLLAHQPLMMRIALTMLALNGFNLLPILPLDGGWVVQALFSARHAVVDVIFRGLAVVGLVALSAWSQERVLSFVAIAMAVALPLSYKLARITREVEASGAEPLSPDDQTIPSATADAIIERVQERFPKRYNNKQKAQFTLQIFEALNARPPAIAAALGLGFLQAAGLAASVIFAVLLTVAQQGNLLPLGRPGQAIPTQRLDPAAMTSWPPDAPLPAPGRLAVVATFEGAQKASDALADVGRRNEADVAARVIGQTVLVSIPAADDEARKRWLAALEPVAKDVFVATPVQPALMQLSCVAPSEQAATAIEHQLGDYLLASHLHLIAPWAEADDRSPDDRQRHARARRTYARLIRLPGELFSDPESVALLKKMVEARRVGDMAEAERLQKEQMARQARLRAESVRLLKAEPDTDSAVAERYASRMDAGGMRDPDGDAAELGPLLGQLALVDGRPEPAAGRTGARGFLTRERLQISLPYLQFADTFVGPSFAVRWLQAQGCTDFRYQLTAGPLYGATGALDELEED
jgi:Zn-dependent protease